MANTKLSAKRGLKMDTHIRRLLIIMVCWFIFMGIMKGVNSILSSISRPCLHSSRNSASCRLVLWSV